LVGDPDIYLGAKLRQTRLTNGVWAWGLSPSKYIHQAVKKCISHLSEKFDRKYRIPTRADNPFPTDYCANTDVTEPLTPEFASFFQHLIGVCADGLTRTCGHCGESFSSVVISCLPSRRTLGNRFAYNGILEEQAQYPTSF
jgi:hypothetical protein